MRTVWNQIIRPTLALGSFIIFVLLVLNPNPGFSGNRALNFHARANLREKVVQVQVDRSSIAQGCSGDTFRALRHLLVVEGGENEVIEKGKDALFHSALNVSKNGDDLPQQPDPSHRIGIRPEGSACTNARQHPKYKDSCAYVEGTPECRSGTLIEYTKVFYCFFSGTPTLAYIALALWLASLFYTLGNTAADFFCSSITTLSTLLHLPPTLTGVTLLPFGNGAPDVFASIAAFVGHSGQGQVGLNSVLGGAMFVSSVVAGAVSLGIIGLGSRVQLDRRAFLRDVGFFLLTLAALTTILYKGEIQLWTSVGFVSIYALYAVTVGYVEFRVRSTRPSETRLPLLSGLPFVVKDGASGTEAQYVEIIDNPTSSAADPTVSQRMWAPHVDVYRQQSVLPYGDVLEVEELKWYTPRRLLILFVHWPLTLPRRLTIPLVEAEGWSKFYAVCSATFAPTLLAMVWDGKDNGGFGSAWREYFLFGIIGILLGGLSLMFLRVDRPPRRYRLLWAAGGFIMSMVWFYIIAMELVASLVALGAVLEIDPAILGLTVLAWGNSVGDLMSNLALVQPDHAQTAFTGCYAGPMFNTLMGIGVSLVLASWKVYPAVFVIPEDGSIFITLAFLVIALVWALIMMLSQNMQPTKTFGISLVVLYFSFLGTRLGYALDVEFFLEAFGIR